MIHPGFGFFLHFEAVRPAGGTECPLPGPPHPYPFPPDSCPRLITVDAENAEHRTPVVAKRKSKVAKYDRTVGILLLDDIICDNLI